MTIPQTAVETRHCRRCELDLPAADFPRGNRVTETKICKACISAICNGDVFTMNATEATTFMARLEGGEALRTIIGGFGGKSICSRKAFFKHCELHPKWGEKALALAATNAKLRVVEGAKQHAASRTHCHFGHALTPDNVTIDERNPWRHRECKTCRAKWEKGGRFSAQQISEYAKDLKTPFTSPVDKSIESDKHYQVCRRCEKDLPLSDFYPAAHGKVSRFCKPCAHAVAAGQVFTMNSTEAAIFLDRLEAGETLRILTSHRGSICSRKAFLRHCEQHPDWGKKAQALADRNALIAFNKRGNRKSFAFRTHCTKGHPLTPDNVGFKMSNGTRYCKVCNSENVARGKIMTPEQDRAIRNAILTNMRISDIIKPVAGRKAICSYGTYRTARRQNPEFNRFIVEHCIEVPRGGASRRLITDDEALQFASTPSRRVVDDIPVYVAEPGDYEWLYGLTPRYLTKSDRDMIVSDLWFELSERRLRREDAPTRVKDLIKKHNRENPSHAYGDIRSPLSLDAPAYLDGTMLRGETVSESLWERM